MPLTDSHIAYGEKHRGFQQRGSVHLQTFVRTLADERGIQESLRYFYGARSYVGATLCMAGIPQFDDIPAAVKNLEEALALLTE